MPSTNFILLLYFATCFSLSFCNTIHSFQDEDLYKLLNSKEMRSKLIETLNISESSSLSLKMLDASTKSIPSGILYGNLYDLGNFDECYNIKEGDIYGKYCLGSLVLEILVNTFNATERFREFEQTFKIHPDFEKTNLGDTMSLSFRIAACVPSSKSAQNISSYFNIQNIHAVTIFTESFCYSKKTDTDLSSGAIATIVVYCIFGALIVASTAFDLYLYNTNKESPHELLLAFSFWTNGRKLFKFTKNSDQMLCLNGIRAISMMWVILGHEFTMIQMLPVSNTVDVADFSRNQANMFITNATLSVDSFFVMGGLVLVYTFLKSNDKGVKFNIFLFYVHRILRLTPVFVMLGLAHMYLLTYMGTGPMWRMVDLMLAESCKKGWWSSFLYISNYVNKGSVCIPQTWYLNVDMQLFILSPLVLLPLIYWPLIGLGVLGFLILAGMFVRFGIVYGEEFWLKEPIAWTNEYYGQPYTRFGPYVIGMAAGYLIYQVKKTGWKLKLPRLQTILVVCCGWLIALSGLIACLYSKQPSGIEDKWGYSLYIAFDRPFWGLSLSILIFLCVTGYGGPINYFLSLSIFQLIAKLSYCIYMLHVAVIVLRVFSMKTLYRFSTYDVMYVFWSDFMFTIFLSLIVCLAFESPVVILEKYLFGRGKPQQNRSDKTIQA